MRGVVIILAVVTVALSVGLFVTMSASHYPDAVKACFPYRVTWTGDERAFCSNLRWREYK